MNKFKELITQHKKVTVITVFLLIMFIGGSAISALNVANLRAQQETQETESSEEDTKSEEVEEESVDLTESQQEAIDAYDDDTIKFIDTLSASVWSSNGHTLRFSDTQYTESSNGTLTTHSYAITRLETSNDQTGAQLVTAVFETDTGTHIVEYTSLTGSSNDGSGEVTSTLSSSSAFMLANTDYTRSDAVSSITINGLNSAVTELLDNKTDELTEELSNWCAVYYPTVTEATWAGTAYIDYNNSFVQLDFTLTGESNISLSVIYHTDTGTFVFGS